MSLSTAQIQAYAVGAALVAVASTVTGFAVHERHVGQETILRHSADSAHVADSTASLKKVTAANVAAQQAETEKAKALAQVAASRALQAKTDSAAQQAASERDRAVILMHDSAATAAQLQAEVGRLVASSRADSAAASRQHAADTLSIHGLLVTIAKKDAALDSATVAYNATLKRAVDAEKQTELVKSQLPSKAGEWAIRGGALVVGIFAGRGSK